jgi:Mg-chelatase subunit ChlI
MGVSQPRVAAIEQSRNVTIDVLEQYADAIGGRLEVTVVKGRKKVRLTAAHRRAMSAARHRPLKKKAATATAGR